MSKWYRCIVGGAPLIVTEEWAAGRPDAQPIEWVPIRQVRTLAESLPQRESSSEPTPCSTSSRAITS